MQYRPEVDGLRAVAVLSVLLFHAGYVSFSGGFIGVDIFFVISGYLITSIIIEERRHSRFSLIKFYERRARRILPALMTVIFCCLPLAWVLLFPNDLIDFSNSLVTVPFFVSNFYFWKTSGYFEGAAEMKPLLHTWSLAVEEQYYLLFPIFLLFIWKIGQRWMIAVLTVIVLLSLVIAERASTVSPVANFYLLPTRAWQLILGALVAAFESFSIKFPATQIGWQKHVAGLAGLGLIAVSVFTFDPSTPTPGLITLIPTLGTVLVLGFGGAGTIVARWLSYSWLVRVGLISYSLYLWHHPLYAFARHGGASLEGGMTSMLLIGATFSLATLSWWLIEKPCRDRLTVNTKTLIFFCVAGNALLVALGVLGMVNNGFDGRISSQQRSFLSYFENSRPTRQYFQMLDLKARYRAECTFYDMTRDSSGSPTQKPVDTIPEHCYAREPQASKVLFLWGDSHAQQLYHGLHETLPTQWQILQVTSAGCVPSIQQEPSEINYCRHSNWFALQAIRKAKPDVVMLGQNNGHNPRTMAELANELLASGAKKVIFVGPTPRWVNELPNLVAQRLLPVTPQRTQIGIDSSTIRLDSRLKAGKLFSGQVEYISLIDFFCNSEGCRVFFGDDVREGITSYDRAHLTPLASLELAKGVLSRALSDDR